MSLNLYPRTPQASAGEIQACSAFSVATSNAQAKMLVDTGPGLATLCILSTLLPKQTKSTYMMQMDNLVGYEWSAGDWNVQIQVSLADDGQLKWYATYICRLDKRNNNLACVASLLGQSVPLYTTGLKQMTVTQAAYHGEFSQSDRLYIVCVFKQGLGGIMSTFSTQLNTTIATPLTPMVTTVQIRGANLKGGIIAP